MEAGNSFDTLVAAAAQDPDQGEQHREWGSLLDMLSQAAHSHVVIDGPLPQDAPDGESKVIYWPVCSKGDIIKWDIGGNTFVLEADKDHHTKTEARARLQLI